MGSVFKNFPSELYIPVGKISCCGSTTPLIFVSVVVEEGVTITRGTRVFSCWVPLDLEDMSLYYLCCILIRPPLKKKSLVIQKKEKYLCGTLAKVILPKCLLSLLIITSYLNLRHPLVMTTILEM